ncbi:MAG TPA: hypothetical protein IAB38_04470 [Candidatus Onthousia excrementipullorum]|uniref:Polymerase/histidinol phosphatase N-terminal domain-containing protein n=1 Tax=Candidatus Onthousia excrementipullorum TaxID=2840884 RepID=A0A9D1DUJ8_9FIRM|nr:hypothetical protein [Candidatus Onthousia excrementipullorum]
MDKIVKQALKVDFHIHSYASHFKDYDTVKEGTIDNLPILISKLEENNVNMISITDHDNFDYNIYSKLKKEEKNNNCIKKVLPGIEFSVTIQNKILHIVTLFDDINEDKIKSIQSYIYNSKEDKPLYDLTNSFSEEKYIEILRTIGTDTILIAHQKESLGSKKQRKHDVNTLGTDELEKLVFVDYFEAYEFKNKRNEIFNNYYIENQQKKLENMRFITGSDCHNWNNYPEENNDGNFEFSYFKCLPSFRGVMMAITDSSRIKIGVSSFFSANAPIKNIELSIGNIDYNIELSKGINAIIGDNSIGKSLLLHKMTDYREISKENKLKKAYDKYLEDNNINIKTRIESNDIRHFDKQGNIRDIFTNNKTKSKDFINEYYPVEPNYDIEKTKIVNKIDEFIYFLKNKKLLNEERKKLTNIKFELQEESMSLQINEITIDFKTIIKNYNDLITSIEQVIIDTENLINNKSLDKQEKEKLKIYKQYLINMKNKYSKLKNNITIEETKVELINAELAKLSTELNNTKTEMQKNREAYNLKFDQLAETIKKLVKINQKSIHFEPTIKEININPAINRNGEYRFICKPSMLKIDSNYISDLIKIPLSAAYKKTITDFNEINPTEFEENVKTGDQTPEDIFEHYKNVIIKKINDDLKIKYVINNSKDDDVTKELSNGANAQIYFDLLSNDTKKPGIYIIDQPEDDVSQPSIKKKLLANFKTLSINRQILLITHNPQFIVNLDVDNVIFIKKDDKTNKISIESGALEYKDDKTDILKIVADNIEGGIDSLKERYKKYEKNN